MFLQGTVETSYDRHREHSLFFVLEETSSKCYAVAAPKQARHRRNLQGSEACHGGISGRGFFSFGNLVHLFASLLLGLALVVFVLEVGLFPTLGPFLAPTFSLSDSWLGVRVAGVVDVRLLSAKLRDPEFMRSIRFAHSS